MILFINCILQIFNSIFFAMLINKNKVKKINFLSLFFERKSIVKDSDLTFCMFMPFSLNLSIKDSAFNSAPPFISEKKKSITIIILHFIHRVQLFHPFKILQIFFCNNFFSKTIHNFLFFEVFKDPALQGNSFFLPFRVLLADLP